MYSRRDKDRVNKIFKNFEESIEDNAYLISYFGILSYLKNNRVEIPPEVYNFINILYPPFTSDIDILVVSKKEKRTKKKLIENGFEETYLKDFTEKVYSPYERIKEYISPYSSFKKMKEGLDIFINRVGSIDCTKTSKIEESMFYSLIQPCLFEESRICKSFILYLAMVYSGYEPKELLEGHKYTFFKGVSEQIKQRPKEDTFLGAIELDLERYMLSKKSFLEYLYKQIEVVKKSEERILKSWKKWVNKDYEIVNGFFDNLKEVLSAIKEYKI